MIGTEHHHNYLKLYSQGSRQVATMNIWPQMTGWSQSQLAFGHNRQMARIHGQVVTIDTWP